MTGSPHHYPPPGAPPPDEPQAPPYGAPPPASYPLPHPRPGSPAAPVPGMLGAAHKPGALPLRPLTLGNIYDAAFRIIRFNPKATVGSAVLVTAVAMLFPIVLSAVVAFTVGTGIGADGEVDEELGTAEALGLLGSFGSLILGIYAAQLGVIFVTGMVAHVTHAAAVGRRLSMAEAWAATYGKRWRLVGQALLVGIASTLAIVLLVGVVVLVAVLTGDVLVTVLVSIALTLSAIPLFVWLWIRVVYLATPALMLEPVGIFGSFGRTWRLTAAQFWRTLGIGLLTALIAGVAGGILTTPVSFGGNLGSLALPEYSVLILVVTQAIALVIQNAFVAPFTAAVTSLQYLDQRMRKEAYDVELMAEAGLIPR
ncbi:hypothetical protein [Nocardioides pelophilus]|uniref:hypothetical protein n=1 Tax=Nocardioides pelophilus TaxID=2172019 RepID=UPI00160284E2|nr:hypothetical protein [Nocardioides pelophilus]